MKAKKLEIIKLNLMKGIQYLFPNLLKHQLSIISTYFYEALLEIQGICDNKTKKVMVSRFAKSYI